MMQRRNGGSGDNIKTDLLENTIKMSREAGSCMMIGVCVCVLLGAFAELRKETISFVMPVHPLGRTRVPLDGF
jgi:hypothetical protein